MRIHCKRFLREERGSISVLVIGLFLLTIALIMVMTNVATIVNAKRELQQATEYSVQAGIGFLDKEAYYTGRGNVVTSIYDKVTRPNDPGIPLDCSQARPAMLQSIYDVESPLFSDLHLIEMSCDSFAVGLKTQARAYLPFNPDVLHLPDPIITASVSAAPERKNGMYLFGIRVW